MSEIQFEVPEVEDSLGATAPEGDAAGFRALPDTDDSGTSEDSAASDSDEAELPPRERKRLKKERRARRRQKKADLQKRWNERKERIKGRKKVTYEKEWQVDIASRLVLREFEGAAECRGATIVEGFPSKGLASTLVAKCLVDDLGLPLVAELAAKGFASSVRIAHGQPMHSCRVYGDSRLVVFMSELVLDSETSCAAAEAILDFAVRHECKRIVCVESLAQDIELDLDEEDGEVSQETVLKKMLGMMEVNKLGGKKKKKKLPRDPSSTPEIRAAEKEAAETIEGKAKQASDKLRTLFIATNDDDSDKLLAMDLDRVKNAIVSGVSGILLAEGSVTEDVDVIALIGRHHPLGTDARAAVSCIDVLAKIVPEVPISSEPLGKKADKLERKIHKAISEMTKTSRRRAPPGMYM